MRVVCRVRLIVAVLVRLRRILRVHVVHAAVGVGTLDGVAGCRGVRGGTAVGRSLWVERSRIIAQSCADRLTALLTATLTATLTGGEILRGFLSPGLPDNPIMSRDDSIEPLYSQGCDQGL